MRSRCFQAEFFTAFLPTPSNEPRLNYVVQTVSQIGVCRDRNLTRILKAQCIVTYVKPNFVFPLLCVSSADVDLWVNGGWDQPNCGITLNPGFLLSFLQNLNFEGKIHNFLIIYASIIVFKIIKQF